MQKYRFNREATQPTFGPKPAGDYAFVVTECSDGPTLSSAKNWVLNVRLAIGDDRATVFDNPWARSEESKDQDGRDGIAQFLVAINMAPKGDAEPNWKGCVGKKGQCRIKLEVAKEGKYAGQEVNKVAFYYVPKEAGEGMSGQSMPASEFEKARKAQSAKSQGAEPEPDMIPY
jgi:hypothetical protein